MGLQQCLNQGGGSIQSGVRCQQKTLGANRHVFGLQNSPATFQSMMNALFDDLIKEGWVIIYMDNILIFSKDLEEHRILVKKVLQRLEEEDLFLKLEKCFFEKPSIEYLGMIISQNKIQMDPAKLSAVLNWPTPKCVKDVQSFLGFGNFYQRFIQGFVNITAPLTSLTEKTPHGIGTMTSKRHSKRSSNDSLRHQFSLCQTSRSHSA